MRLLSGPYKYITPYWRYVGLNIIFNLLSIFFGLFTITLAIPFLGLLFGTEKPVTSLPEFSLSAEYMQAAFNYFITGVIQESGREAALIRMSLLVLLMFFLKNLCRYMAMYFLAPVRNGVIMDIRNALFNKVLILPLAFYSNERKGDIMARMNNDVQEIEWSVIGAIEMVFRDPPTVIIYLITLFVMSPSLTMFSLILIPLAGLLIGKIGKSLKRSSDVGMKQTGDLLSIIEETLGGLRIIKAFRAESQLNGRFTGMNNDLRRVMNRIYRKKDLASPMSELMGSAVIVSIMWYGGSSVLSGNSTLSPEVFMTFILVFTQILPPIKAITQAYYNLQKGRASLDRVNQILDAENTIPEKDNPKSIDRLISKVEFQNVSFDYIGSPVISEVNFSLEKGKTIALVGPSGSGKSTLADLLSRFYDVKSGAITIDGVDLRDLKLSDLRGLMGIVSQESILFNDTVFNNIALGNPNATMEAVVEAARLANAHDFISTLENGYDTVIGDRGSKLSGGQRQRLSIARAVLKNPDILILDEATSALDTESERLVQDALSMLMKNRTSLVIAHRLSTIRHADEILVLENGKIIERGTHDLLISHGGMYKRLCDLQEFR
jgi:ATP-binding cassette, subfamily B, bacterial MsbA